MLGTPLWTPQEANFVMSDRLRAIAGPEEVKGCRSLQPTSHGCCRRHCAPVQRKQ